MMDSSFCKALSIPLIRCEPPPALKLFSETLNTFLVRFVPCCYKFVTVNEYLCNCTVFDAKGTLPQDFGLKCPLK